MCLLNFILQTNCLVLILAVISREGPFKGGYMPWKEAGKFIFFVYRNAQRCFRRLFDYFIASV